MSRLAFVVLLLAGCGLPVTGPTDTPGPGSIVF